jgi:hypothetical protein
MSKWSEVLEELEPVVPMHLIQLKAKVHRLSKKGIHQKISSMYELTDFSKLFDQESFAKLYLGWHEEGLLFKCEVNVPFTDVSFPDYTKGDAIELLIATRSPKTPYMNRYSHHIVILPKEKEGVQCVEITRLRYEEERPLMERAFAELEVTFHRSSYELCCFFSKEALYGYDPSFSKELAFHATIYRAKEEPQFFSFSKKQYKSILNPKLWAQITLED